MFLRVVLGPLLFLLYFNDLPGVLKYGSCTAFQNDTTVLWHHKDPVTLKQMIDDDLGSVKLWCDANGLTFNIAKTSILNFRGNIETLQ